MTTIANIATRILAENNYTTSDCTAINCEFLIKKAVEHVNLMIGSTIAFVPNAGAESLTASDGQLTAIQNLSTLLLRAYVDRGPNASVGGVSISTLISDPQYSLHMKLIDEQIHQLIGRDFERT